MGSFKDLVGQKFGRWTVISRADNDAKFTRWLCECTCGVIRSVQAGNLKSGASNSCGCLKIEIATERIMKYKNKGTHSLSYHPLYSVWGGIKSRCYNPKHAAFEHYGGKGIYVCDEWLHDPKEFIEWALLHRWKLGLTVDRRDSSREYSPANCQIVDWFVQANNTSRNRRVHTPKGLMTLGETARRFGISVDVLRGRANRGDEGDRLVRPLGSRKCEEASV